MSRTLHARSPPADPTDSTTASKEGHEQLKSRHHLARRLPVRGGDNGELAGRGAESEGSARRCAPRTVAPINGTAAVARGRWIVSGEVLLASRQYAHISNASIINRAKLFHFVRMRAAHPEERVGRGQQQ
jgi:hypothetical protein